ncbi:TOBE domain-containing protein [Saccharopolyspora sp. WRP15-2]|uniref:TOBE domain-containing protein n=1 Tax=Saccharopolyspora oryzae TaxID=2997343 RepID=A0ABT4VB35_9PSEU|nr:TOBE domain-containing protein [Saccharopolyspora oryzae]MDA3630624.1 TOBE domain-containing protein [Saccharopolyspora oryzae]
MTFGVRPEALSLVSSEDDGLAMTVELVEELGADALIHGAIDIGGSQERFVVRADGRTPPALGQQVKVSLRDHSEIHLFHPETGTRRST